MAPLPSSGLLVYCRGPRAAIEVLLLVSRPVVPSSADGRPSLPAVYRVPSWEHRGDEPPGPPVSGDQRLRRRPRRPDPTPDALLATARAGFAAAFGQSLDPPFLGLGGVKQHGHRILYVWARELDAATARSLAGVLVGECPAALVELPVAARGIVAGQRRFLEQLGGLTR